jgi:dephospho-CoA kinase/formamidopyrimidine-DNA glycosylase
MKINLYKWGLKHGKIIVGLTGSLAGGKTTLAKYFKTPGVKILDADKTAVNQLDIGKYAYKKVLRKFKAKVLNPDGSINKQFLADKIFSSPSLRKWLENAIHPYVLKEFKKTIKKTKHKIIICDVALLFERNLDDWFHLTVCVGANREICLERAKKRGWSKKEFDKRSKAQLPVEVKIVRADTFIDNSGSLPAFHKKAERLLKTIKKLN